MDRKKILGALLTAMIAAALVGCASGKKQYELGLQLKEQGNYRDAIAQIEQAAAAEPKNEAYLRALADAKNAYVGELLADADSILRSKVPPSMQAIQAAGVKIAEARQVDPYQPAVVEYTGRLQKEESHLRANVKRLHSQAVKNIEEMRWVEAHADLQQIQRLLPGFEDTDRLVKVVAARGAPALLHQGKKLFDRHAYREAAGYFLQVLDIDPQLQEARTYLDLARERDNKEYFAEEGRRALSNGNWEKSEWAFKRALAYDPADEEVKKAISSVRYKSTLHYMREARSHMFAGWLFNAFESYAMAKKNADTGRYPELKSDLLSLGNQLGTTTGEVAKRFAQKGRYGTAWFWYQKIKHVDADYPDLSYLCQAMEEQIIQRLRKSIAVFDFEPPSNAPDAGVIFANKLSAFLFKNAGKNIKIMQGEALRSKIDDMQLGRIGASSTGKAKEMGRVYGIDMVVMGNVLRHGVDSSSFSDTKTVTYQVKKTEENIDYLNWKARNPNPTKEELDAAPVPFIHKMVDMEKVYNVSTHKKVAFVTVSFRIVDVDTGESILVDTIVQNKTAIDETSAGVQIAGIQHDPLVMPTDTELLQGLTDEVVKELGSKTLRPLQALEMTYFDLGEKNLQRSEDIIAAEYFVDAVFNEKIKGIEKSQLATEAGWHLDDIFRQFKVPSEG